eukprot:CAMPEP_0184688370 /NCGR_PEP_ID=MMETSP0312-20130426/29646_1 /TAXON_ID=31354 /ORGANISM="Compsopogon coeruleus, Strain SAG 36.94" /LENGTH=162 /DNA_ID=CAMNT_0027145459 /DNA_START=56 /DNA_END=545 /DNA_ORIENTATION=+
MGGHRSPRCARMGDVEEDTDETAAEAEGVHAANKSPVAPLERDRVRRLNSTEDFLEMLEEGRNTLVVIKFFASSCRACKAVAPKFVKAAQEFPEFLFCEIDYAELKELCWRLGVLHLPHVQFYSGERGRVEDFDVGPSTIDKLIVKLRKHALQLDTHQATEA